jgi:hypothetical protein
MSACSFAGIFCRNENVQITARQNNGGENDYQWRLNDAGRACVLSSAATLPLPFVPTLFAILCPLRRRFI